MAGSPGNTTSIQECEIGDIRASFDGQVRVISGIGDFTNVVTIHPDGLDLHCKFQLTGSYPHTTPTISIRSSVLNADQTSGLTSSLQNEAASRLGHVMIAELMASCKTWLQDNEVDVSAKAIAEKSKDKKRRGKSKQINKAGHSKSDNADDDISQKKPPMRTAADVIKRLQWDAAIDKEDFIVGYMDRIVGLVEKKFTAFTWEDLASVDIYSLAIPQHRIQYFKYKAEKVWDKNERLDNVFGSTGGKLTIVEAIKKFEDKQKDLCTDEDREVKNETKTNEAEECGGGAEGTYEFETEEELEGQSDDQTGEMASARAYNRPNYFVALQITDERTVEKLLQAQADVMSRYPRYADYKIPPNGFHLTLAVLKLDTVADNQACIEAMNKAKPELESLARKARPLTFEGLDHFSTRVIFAKVKFSQEFLALVDTIRAILDLAGFHMETSAFKPHLTLFNVKRSAFAGKSWDKNNLMLNTCNVVDQHFGPQAVDNIQVCRMGTLPEAETSTEFYQSIFSMEIE